MISKIVFVLGLSFVLICCGSKTEVDNGVKSKENSSDQVSSSSTEQVAPAGKSASGKFTHSGNQTTSGTPMNPVDPNAPEPIQNETVQTSSSKVNTSNNSTLQVAGKAVIIYFPTNEDMLNTPETEANAGIVEVLSEFEQEARQFQVSTGLKGVQVFWSTDRFVSVQLEDGTKKVFERNMVDRLVGVIFTDGKKQPVEEQSLLTTEEYRKRAKKFFGQ
jgi:hypothetical protein